MIPQVWFVFTFSIPPTTSTFGVNPGLTMGRVTILDCFLRVTRYILYFAPFTELCVSPLFWWERFCPSVRRPPSCLLLKPADRKDSLVIWPSLWRTPSTSRFVVNKALLLHSVSNVLLNVCLATCQCCGWSKLARFAYFLPSMDVPLMVKYISLGLVYGRVRTCAAHSRNPLVCGGKYVW